MQNFLSIRRELLKMQFYIEKTFIYITITRTKLIQKTYSL